VRKTVVTLALTALFGGLAATPALAGPPVPTVPSVPKNCHEWNSLLGIQNVRSCDEPEDS
jgi:hypothetical protein